MQTPQPYKQIMNFIMEIIEQTSFAPDYKLPSERMLAVKFKASRRSVRLAYENLISQGFVRGIHGKGYFTTGNKKKHETTAQLSLKKIYFIIPSLQTGFAQDILNGITDFCDEHTMDVSIKISKGNFDKEMHYVTSAFTSDAKGVILFPSDNESINSALLKLSANRYPVAIIDRYFKNANFSFISTDNHNAMIEAVKFLHTKKHKHFLYLTPPSSLATSVVERLNGFKDGVEKYYGEKEAPILTIDNFGHKEICQGITNYLKAHPETEVILTTGVRNITDAIITAVQAQKRNIPKDIKLMIFDNDFSSTEIKLIRPYAIQQNGYQIGYQSAAALYNQMYGDLRAENIRLPINIIDYTKPKVLKQNLAR